MGRVIRALCYREVCALLRGGTWRPNTICIVAWCIRMLHQPDRFSGRSSVLPLFFTKPMMIFVHLSLFVYALCVHVVQGLLVVFINNISSHCEARREKQYWHEPDSRVVVQALGAGIDQCVQKHM